MRPSASRRRISRRALLCLTTILGTGAAAPAFAQEYSPPPYEQSDENGVDLVTGQYHFEVEEGSSGSGEDLLSMVRYWTGSAGWRDNWSGGLVQETLHGITQIKIELGDISDEFNWSGSAGIPVKGNGATLVPHGLGYQYTASDGTIIRYQTSGDSRHLPLVTGGCSTALVYTCGIPVSIIRPNGMTFTLEWEIVETCVNTELGDCTPVRSYARLGAVVSSTGRRLEINYVTDDPELTPVTEPRSPPGEWYERASVTFIDPSQACAATSSCPTITYARSGFVTNVTDTLGRPWRFTQAGYTKLASIKRPGSSTDNIQIAYGTNGVSSVTKNGITTAYNGFEIRYIGRWLG